MFIPTCELVTLTQARSSKDSPGIPAIPAMPPIPAIPLLAFGEGVGNCPFAKEDNPEAIPAAAEEAMDGSFGAAAEIPEATAVAAEDTAELTEDAVETAELTAGRLPVPSPFWFMQPFTPGISTQRLGRKLLVTWKSLEYFEW